MEANANVVNKKKSFKEKFHDYMMGMSKIVPFGLNDKEDKYYHSIFNYGTFWTDLTFCFI